MTLTPTRLKERKNLTLDSISLGRNEAGYDVAWIKSTRRAMDAAGYADVKVIAADDHRGGGSPGRLSHSVPISIQTRSKIHTITSVS